MRIQALRRAAFWLGVAVTMAFSASSCGGDGTNQTSASTGRTSSSSTSSSGGEGGAGGAGGAGGEGGAGGAGGGAVVDDGHAATETVTAGEVAKSETYKMIFTFG